MARTTPLGRMSGTVLRFSNCRLHKNHLPGAVHIKLTLYIITNQVYSYGSIPRFILLGVLMAFSPLDSDLLGPLFTTKEMRDALSERRFLGLLLRVETALARAQAAEGLVSRELANSIAGIDPGSLDIKVLAEQTRLGAVPVIPFVKSVQAMLPPDVAGGFHFGTTSQDIMDTAIILQMAKAVDLIETDLRALLSSLCELAEEHCETPCIGRTAGQHASPVTFGFKVAGWCVAIAEHLAQVEQLKRRVLVLSLAGPVGTLTQMGDRAGAVATRTAADLGLAVPAMPWHTHRSRIVELGSWLAILLGILAKMATDVVHLATSEVGEVSEPAVAGRGGSSAMPHKRNPVGSMIILAQHSASVGHLSTLVTAMASLHERPVGAWHSEWLALPSLVGLAAGALREARLLAGGLEVDAARMYRNIELTNGMIFSDAVAGGLAKAMGRAEAYTAVEEEVANVVRSGGHLRERLTERFPAHHSTILQAFELTPAINAAASRCRTALISVRKQLA